MTSSRLPGSNYNSYELFKEMDSLECEMQWGEQRTSLHSP